MTRAPLTLAERAARHRAAPVRVTGVAGADDGGACPLRRALPDDAAAIHALLDGFVARGLLLPRTRAQIEAAIADFVVVVDHGRIVGCGALRLHSAELAEICALAVAEDHHGAGLGRRVVHALVQDARLLGVRRVFALTMQEGFFRRLAFEPVPVTEFPTKIAADCSTCARRGTCGEVAVARSLIR